MFNLKKKKTEEHPYRPLHNELTKITSLAEECDKLVKGDAAVRERAQKWFDSNWGQIEGIIMAEAKQGLRHVNLGLSPHLEVKVVETLARFVGELLVKKLKKEGFKQVKLHVLGGTQTVSFDIPEFTEV